MPIAPEKLQNLDPEFIRRLEAAVAAAEAATGASTPITDAYRDSKTQAQYYANYTQKPVTWEGVTYKPQKQGGLAAAPGQSYHQSGKAVDIASGPVLDWLHQNAGKFGLEFLPGAAGKMDPVHIQLAGSNAQFAGNPFGVTGTAPSPPPMPNLRQDALAFGGVNPFDTAPPPGSPPALAPPPTQFASSWLPKSLQPGGSGFVDDLGGGMSPLHPFSVAESSDVPAGPFGADALVRAAMAGDQAGVKKALGDITGAAIGAIFSGKGSKDQITQQINDYLGGLATSAPGAVRQVQTALATNPALLSILAPDQQAQVKAALAALPPQATGQVAMPNLRPPQPDALPPLVAGPTPDPLAPKMASFAPPSQPGGFGSGLDPTQLGTLQKLITGGGADSWMPGVARSLSNLVTAPGSQEAPPSPPQWPSFPGGDNLDMRTNPGSANAAPTPYAPPAPSAAGLAQLLGRGPQPASSPPPPPPPDFGSFFDPTSAMASQQSPQQMAGGFTPPSSFSPPPFPSLASLNPTQMRGLEGATGQGSIQFMPPPSPGMPNFGAPPNPMMSSLTGGYGPAVQSTMGRSPMLSSLTGGYGAALGWLVPPKQAPSWLPPSLTARAQSAPQPPPMGPMQMFQAMYGPAPQNVNWQATLAPDPFSQAAPGTYVLQDFGSRGPPQNALQEAASQQGDSYLSYPDFSFGY